MSWHQEMLEQQELFEKDPKLFAKTYHGQRVPPMDFEDIPENWPVKGKALVTWGYINSSCKPKAQLF